MKSTNSCCSVHNYDTAELRELLEKKDMKVIECRGIGSLTHLYLIHLYRQNPKDIHRIIEELIEDPEFLEICDYYDKNVLPDGMGSFRRAGILAIAEK